MGALISAILLIKSNIVDNDGERNEISLAVVVECGTCGAGMSVVLFLWLYCSGGIIYGALCC